MGCCCCWGNSQWLAYKWSDTKQCVHCRQWINNACARRRHQLFIVIDIERYVHCLVDLTVMQKSANLSVVVALSIDIAIVRNTAPSFSTNHLQCIDMALIPGSWWCPLFTAFTTLNIKHRRHECLHYLPSGVLSNKNVIGNANLISPLMGFVAVWPPLCLNCWR